MLRSAISHSLAARAGLASLASLVFFAFACGSSSTSSSGGTTPIGAPDGGDPASDGGGPGGSSWSGAFDAVDELATEQNAPRRLVTDASHVYWLGGPTGANGARGSFGYVRSVTKAGGGSATELAKDLPYPLALALADDGLYFTAYDLNANDGWSTGLRRTAPSGGAAEIVHLVPTGSDPFGACSAWGPTELVADGAELLAGYTECGFDLKSTAARDVTPQQGPQGQTLNAFGERYALTASAIYAWRHLDASTNDLSLVAFDRAAKAAAPKTIAVVPSDHTQSNTEAEVERDAIVAAGDYVYAGVSKPGIPQVSGEVGQLLRIAIATGKIDVLASFDNPPLRVTGIAVDDRNVYFTVSSDLLLTCTTTDGAVYAAPLDGSKKPVAIASSLGCPRAVAVDDDGVYFTEMGAYPEESATGHGRLLRMKKTK